MGERLRKFDRAELDDEQAAIYEHYTAAGERARSPRAITLLDDDGHLMGPPNAWLLSPGLGMALQSLGFAVRYATELTPRMQEIAILVVAQRTGSAFEEYAHRAAASQAGLSDADIDALMNAEPVDFADPAEQACQRLAGIMFDREQLSDAEYADAVATLGRKRLLELTAIVGWYRLIALQLSVFGVVPPA
jgi:4-carboxymuconolactone decarboxylase